MLILSYLVTQVAAMPHAHNTVPANHQQRSHLHVGWLVNWLGDGHYGKAHHKHRHHSHSHGGSEHEHSHDDDSIDVPTFVATADRDAGSIDPFQGFVDLLTRTSTGCEFASLEASIQACSHVQAEMPGPDCALYLTLRTLRI